MKTCGSSETIYGLGVVGAAFYFLQHVTTFLGILIGLGKAIIWPALVVFEILGLLKI